MAQYAHVVVLNERVNMFRDRGNAPAFVQELEVLRSDDFVDELVHTLAELALAVAVAHDDLRSTNL